MGERRSAEKPYLLVERGADGQVAAVVLKASSALDRKKKNGQVRAGETGLCIAEHGVRLVRNSGCGPESQ